MISFSLFGILEDEKTALDMAAEDLVPHHQGVSLAKGVAEPDPLASGKRCVRVRGSESALTAVDQATLELQWPRGFNGEPHLAFRRLASFPPLFRYAGLLCHATESSNTSLTP